MTTELTIDIETHQVSVERVETGVMIGVDMPGLTLGMPGLPGPQGSPGDDGADGPTGPQGPPGADGRQGVDGEPGVDGSPGSPGPKGDKGDPGDDGAAGADGADGATGATGATGAQGPQGLKGDKGDTGTTGATGAPGAKGDKGDTGTTGPQGVAGATGSTGPTGAPGTAGAAGATGAAGTPGTKWYYGSGAPSSGPYNNGDLYLDGANSNIWVYNTSTVLWVFTGINIKGATGATGPSGPGRQLAFRVAGILSVTGGTTRFYNDTAATWTIVSVRASVETAPSGGVVTCDINKNGTTIFTTQSHRPTIADATTTIKVTNIDVPSVAAGDYLTIDVDVTTAPAAELTVLIYIT